MSTGISSIEDTFEKKYADQLNECNQKIAQIQEQHNANIKSLRETQNRKIYAHTDELDGLQRRIEDLQEELKSEGEI